MGCVKVRFVFDMMRLKRREHSCSVTTDSFSSSNCGLFTIRNLNEDGQFKGLMWLVFWLHSFHQIMKNEFLIKEEGSSRKNNVLSS